MQSGILNSDNYSQVFRQLSQKRSHGILEIKYGDNILQLVFIQGKIVEAVDSSIHPIEELLQKLKAGGYVQEDFVYNGCDEESEEIQYKDLFCQLEKEAPFINEDIFKRALKHRILDRIFSLNFSLGAYYTFKVQMMECEREFLPSFSVGQILLDFVALESDAERFESLFSPNTFIVRSCSGEPSLSEDETVMYDAIGEGRSVEDLRRISMLSAFHVQDALLCMHDRGEITVSEDSADHSPKAPQKSAASADLSNVDDMVAALERSIDTSFASMAEELPPLEDEDSSSEAVIVKKELKLEAAQEEADFVEAEDEEELEEEYYEPTAKAMHVGVLNMRLLHSTAIPYFLIFVFIICSILVPLFYWEKIYLFFALS